MKVKNKKIITCAIIIYFLIYLLSCIIGDFQLIALLKPFPTLLALYSIRYFVVISKEQKGIFNTLCYALIAWFIADLLSAAGEFLGYQLHISIYTIDNVELVLYASVRCLLLIAVVKSYFYVARGLNRFQIVSDIITTLDCICASVWIIFVRGKTEYFMDERLVLLLQFDPRTVCSFFYLCLSMTVFGFQLILLFQLEKKQITIGLKLIIVAVPGIFAVDMILALNNSLVGKTIYLDIAYKVFILLIALGGVFFNKDSSEVVIRKKISKEIKYVACKNAIYLFIYPVFVISIVGFHATVLLYLLIIAFYVISCMYVKQIAITDNLLEIEKVYNERLKLYSNVVEQAQLSIVITDIDGNIQYTNPYFTKVSGYSAEAAKGKNPRILKSNKTPSSTYEKLWANLTSGEMWSGDFINIDKNGQEYEEKAVISPIKDDNNQTTHYVAIKEDVSETNRIRKQLNNQNYFTSQLLDTIPSAIFYVSVSGMFMGANKALKRMYGIQEDEFMDMKMLETPWVKDDIYLNFVQMKEEAIKNNTPSIRQIKKNTILGEEATLLFSVSPYFSADKSVSGYLGVMTDISELKQKEKALELAIVQANEATEVKSQFLANMSHEIRTPMNAIIGMSYLVLKTELDLKQLDYIQKINAAATTLLGIINDILDFLKIEAGKMELEQEEFDLDSIVRNTINLLAHKAYEKKLGMFYHLSGDIPYHLKGDSLRLGQVITNLVSNAVKFTDKGEIHIDITEEARKGNHIYLRFSVRDTGIGIAEENQKKLFEAFTQSDSSTTRQFGGTGLGLAICKKLVEIMDGEIWIESELGKGSNFIFTARFYFQENEDLENSISDLKALFVDDNTTSREMLLKYSSEMGIRADAVSTGTDALYRILMNDRQEPYKIVFIDGQLPDMNGIQLIEKVSAFDFLEHAPILLLITSDDQSNQVQLAKGIKVDGYIEKPISRSVLYNTIVKLCKTEQSNNCNELFSMEKDYKLSGLKILLAEDNEVNQQITYELLSEQGIAIDIVDNGKEALDRIAQYQDEETYDMILMDLQMPVMDGLESTKQIRNINKDIPIIAMTARTMLNEKDNCYEIGMNDHIAKPINPEDLFNTIQKWVSPRRRSELQSNPSSVRTQLKQPASALLIQGIDTKAGIKRVAGNVEAYLKILRSFAIKYESTVNEISKELGNENYEAVGQLAHMLKGISGNVGAVAIQDICDNLETTADISKDSIEMNRLRILLEEQMKSVIKSILDNTQETEDGKK